MDNRISLISLVWIGTLWGSQVAVDHPLVKTVTITCGSESHQVSDVVKTFATLPKLIQEQLIRKEFLTKGYVECEGVLQPNPLYIAKTEVVEFQSTYDTGSHRRPARHPLNPFIVGHTPNEPISFAYTLDAVLKVPQKEPYFVPHFFDHTTGKEYYMRPDHADEDAVRQFIGPNKNGLFVFFDHTEGTMHIGRLYEDRCNRKASCWNPESHTSKMLYLKRPDLADDFAPKCDHTDPVTALALDSGDRNEPIDASSHDAHALIQMLIVGQARHLYKNGILEGRKSGRVLYHEFNERATGPRGSFLLTPHLSTQELPVQVVGSVRDLSLSKERSIAWILDSEALYTYNMRTKKQTTVCKLPHLTALRAGTNSEIVHETILRCVPSPDERYALLGGDQGSLLLVDGARKNCHIIEATSGHAIRDMWWNEKNRVVILSSSGVVKAYTLEIGTQDSYGEELIKSHQSNEAVSPVDDQDTAAHEPRIHLTGNARQVHLSKDALIAWILDEETLSTFSLKTLKQKHLCKMPPLPPRKDYFEYDSEKERNFPTTTREGVMCFALSPHEQYTLLGGSQGSVLLYDFARNIYREIDALPDDGIKAISWSQEGHIHIGCISGSYREFTLQILPDGSLIKTNECYWSSKFESSEIDELIAGAKQIA